MSIQVMIADDHAIIREGLELILNMTGDFVVDASATNGNEAVRQAQQSCPDVVLMDIAMPVLNGIEATQQISESCPQTRVIILSMYATRQHVARALQAGAQGYLIKESAGKEVVAAIRAVYAGRHYFSEKITDLVIENITAQDAALDPLARLTRPERTILQLVAEGKSSAEIAPLVALSPKTVETYRSRLMQKLHLSDLPALVKFAIHSGLIALD